MSALVLTGSARADSYTRRLGALIADATPDALLAPRLTDLPFFDQDLESDPPAAVQQLREQVAAADVLLVVTPEYNGTIPGLLGNAIDWLSRPYDGCPAVLRGKPVLAVAASPGGVGGARAVVALRTVLANAGAQLVGPPVTVDLVHERLSGEALTSLVDEIASLVADLETQPLAA